MVKSYLDEVHYDCDKCNIGFAYGNENIDCVHDYIKHIGFEHTYNKEFYKELKPIENYLIEKDKLIDELIKKNEELLMKNKKLEKRE